MKMDYHLHTDVTIDGNMTEIEACERAQVLGIEEIAFTNHVMLNQSNYLISPGAITRHLKKIKECQDRFPDLRIRLGLEVDYYPGRERDIREKIQSYELLLGRPFDIILGSIHDIWGGFFSNRDIASAFFKARDLVTTYREYYELAACAVQSQLFDIMAHPDLIKKYTHDLTLPVPWDSYADMVEKYINALIAYGVGIEINTKGMKLPIREPYPSEQFLSVYLARVRESDALPILTMGSDAHKSVDVGYGLSKIKESLQAKQVTTLMSFNQRVKMPIEL